MKKKQALAIIIASSMALSIVGCGGAEMSASEGSSEIEVTEEAKREIAKSEMIAADASSVASSVETAATSASSGEQAIAASSDAATTAVSANKEATPVKLADHELMYNGKVLSVLNDASKTLTDLGTYDKKITDSPYEVFYTYDASGIEFSTYLCDGKELPLGIDVDKKGVTTSRNIGVGDTKDKIVSAYGNPSEKSDPSKQAENTYYYKYNFDKFSIWFYISTKNNTVVLYEIDNTANVEAKDKAEKNAEKAKAAENTAANASSSAATTAASTTATPQPAATTENKQTAHNEEKFGSCGKAFADVVKKSHDANSNAKYALLYLTKDQTPDLVVDNPGKSISLYTFENGKLITMISDWRYGVSSQGYGTTSYCYLPYENRFLENTNNCLGYIDHYAGEETIICDCSYNFLPFWPKVAEVVPSGDADAPRREANMGENFRRSNSGENNYMALSQSGLTEEDANRILADTHWEKLEGSMDYDTLLSKIEALGL
ncbi:hypothetical protein [Butyrivibrio sp. M55]|uniref:hypothetical protein n=1 Tax=Butyrivibrio sp. M55 TaxID=1855323 RepID=UPI0008E4B88F|nr:hypothetical protein [Butyrivibrio sp. M55]SFU73466.1 hypothetical protein SAMN05216540_107136 [Butyrivibrio sp. M55]